MEMERPFLRNLITLPSVYMLVFATLAAILFVRFYLLVTLAIFFFALFVFSSLETINYQRNDDSRRNSRLDSVSFSVNFRNGHLPFCAFVVFFLGFFLVTPASAADAGWKDVWQNGNDLWYNSRYFIEGIRSSGYTFASNFVFTRNSSTVAHTRPYKLPINCVSPIQKTALAGHQCSLPSYCGNGTFHELSTEWLGIVSDGVCAPSLPHVYPCSPAFCPPDSRPETIYKLNTQTIAFEISYFVGAIRVPAFRVYFQPDLENVRVIQRGDKKYYVSGYCLNGVLASLSPASYNAYWSINSGSVCTSYFAMTTNCERTYASDYEFVASQPLKSTYRVEVSTNYNEQHCLRDRQCASAIKYFNSMLYYQYNPNVKPADCVLRDSWAHDTYFPVWLKLEGRYVWAQANMNPDDCTMLDAHVLTGLFQLFSFVPGPCKTLSYSFMGPYGWLSSAIDELLSMAYHLLTRIWENVQPYIAAFFDFRARIEAWIENHLWAWLWEYINPKIPIIPTTIVILCMFVMFPSANVWFLLVVPALLNWVLNAIVAAFKP